MRSMFRRLRLRMLGLRGEQDEVGRAGERAAARALRRSGYRVIARNVHVEFGELDLLCVAPDKWTIVGVEVKARSVGALADGAGNAGAAGRREFPAEAKANQEKRRKVRAIVQQLAKANGWQDRPLRVDVVGVDLPAGGEPIVRHHVNVPTG